MSDNELTTKLNILPGDTSGVESVDSLNQRIAESKKRVEQLALEFGDLDDIRLERLQKAIRAEFVDRFNKEVDELREGLLKADKSAGKLADSLDKVAKTRGGIQKLDDQIEQLDSKIEKARTERMKQSVEQVGDTSTAFGSAASVINAFGGGTAAGEAFALAGDVTGLVEYLPRLKEALIGFGPITAAAAAAIGIAIAAMSRFNDEGSKITAGLRDVIEREREFYELRVAGTTESIQAAIEAAEFEVKVAEARKAEFEGLQAAYDETGKQLGVFTGAVIEAGGALGLGGLQNVRDFRLEADAASKDLDKANKTLALYKGLLGEETTARNDAAAELDKLIEKEKELTQQRQDSLDKIQSLNDQEKDLNAKFNQQQITQMVDRARQMARVDEDYKIRDLRAEEDHNRQLLKLEKDYQTSITKTITDSQKQVADVIGNLAKQEQAAAEKRADVLDEFNETIADAEEKYRKQAEKDAIEFGRRRREIENNFQREASEARLDFDVRAFKDAQDEQKRELADLRTDRKDAKNERLEELKEEREAANENHDERLKQIDEEVTKAREQAAERITQINEQQQAQIESLKATHEERLAEDAETRRIMRERELEDRARTAERQREDYEILTLRQKNAHDQQIKHLNDLELKELAIYYERVAQLDTLIAKQKELSGLIGVDSSAAAPIPDPGINQLPPSPPPPPITGGGFAPGLSASSLARRSPLANPAAFANRSAGGGARGGNTTVINMTALVGENVTPSEVNALANQLRQEYRQGDENVVIGTVEAIRERSNVINSGG